MNTELADLARTYDYAASARSALKRQPRIARIFRQMDRCDQSIADLTAREKAARIELQDANRARRNRGGATRSVRGKSWQTRRSGNAYAALQDILIRLERKSAEREELEWQLGADPDWAAVSQTYYETRHDLLVAIAEREKIDGEWYARKLRYMAAAGLTIAPWLVWCDATSLAPRCVNLYYGGADDPDGSGHGHIIIETQEGGDTYHTTYRRLPKPVKLLAVLD